MCQAVAKRDESRLADRAFDIVPGSIGELLERSEKVLAKAGVADCLGVALKTNGLAQRFEADCALFKGRTLRAH